jgi:hypothetical protein
MWQELRDQRGSLGATFRGFFPFDTQSDAGVFERVANLGRAGDIADYINDRRALLAVQIDPEFPSRDRS